MQKFPLDMSKVWDQQKLQHLVSAAEILL